nr:MAG TPA: hypothetical protein [Bacteriophage sp.]
MSCICYLRNSKIYYQFLLSHLFSHNRLIVACFIENKWTKVWICCKFE